MSEISLNPSTAAVSDGAESPGTEHKRILMVEGDGFTRLVLLLRLRLAGFGVDFTSNGILGLGKLRSCHPDILLVELKLGGMSGLELIKAARADPTFGDRPIYVFTHADRMNRATRKEVGSLATEVFDKRSITREDLVHIFTAKFLNKEQAAEPTSAARTEVTLNESGLSGALEELIAGIREQSEVFIQEGGAQVASGAELQSRVSSLASCAQAARAANLARQAKALENYLSQLSGTPEGYPEAVLNIVNRAVEVLSQISLETGTPGQRPTPIKAVFVDEAPYSNRAIDEALLNAGFEPICFEDPGRARGFLAANPTELIIANMVLPEGHGLALADIRQLPLHADTPVLFVSESSFTPRERSDLPIGAPRLDREPLLLAELVLRALNQAQSREIAETAGSTVESSADDRFELFAQSSKPESTAALDSAPEGAPVEANGAQWPQPFNHQFSGESAGCPSPSPVEPEVPDVDREVQFAARLPVVPIDEVQAEEHPVETLPTSTLQSQGPPKIEPELSDEDKVALAAWLAAAANQSDAAAAAPEIAPENGQEGTAVEESIASVSNDGELMNNQFLAARGDFAHQSEAQHDNRIAAGQSAEERCAELEQEVAALRQAFEGLNGGLSDAPSSGQIQDLEQQLNQKTAELEKQKLEQQSAEAELRQQLEAATAATAQNEAARQQAEARCAELEQELKRAKPTGEQKSGGRQEQTEPWAGAPANELEQQVRQGVADLARVTAELAKERGERQRSQQRAADLNGRLQSLHEDYSRTLQAQREDLARISSLEEQQHQISQALDRSTADLEQQQAERRLAEEQLQKAQELNAQLQKDLSFFDEANKQVDGSRHDLQGRLETSLTAARESEARAQQANAERQRLTESLEESQRELQNQSRRREGLEQELQAAQQALQARESKLKNDTAERQRLSEELGSLQRNHQGGSERDLEFSKIQSALQVEQVERKRQETELARMRQSAQESAQAARTLRANLRRQVREPVDNLIHSAQGLLEMEMGDEQKKLAEAVLQDVLLVQTRLREPGLASDDAREIPAAPTQSPA